MSIKKLQFLNVALFACVLTFFIPIKYVSAEADYVQENTSTNFSWEVSEEKEIPWYNNEHGDGNVSFVRDGEDLWAFYPKIGGGLNRWKGTSFDDLAKQPDGVTDDSWIGWAAPEPPMENDDHHWLNGIWKGTDDKLYAVVHIEYIYPGPSHINSSDEWTWAFRKMALASSEDMGATWHYEDLILTDPGTELGDKSTYEGDYAPTGQGDPGIFIDEKSGYIYMYTYTAYYKKVNQNRETWDHNGRALQVARSPIEKNGAPGTWEKFYNGEWSEPGIGGKATSIVKDAQWTSISYNDYLEKYVMFQVNEGAVNISTSEDLETQEWTTPQFFSKNTNVYLTAVDSSTDDQTITGKNIRLLTLAGNAGTYMDITFDKDKKTIGPAEAERYAFHSVDNDSYMWNRNTLPIVSNEDEDIKYSGDWSRIAKANTIIGSIMSTNQKDAYAEFTTYGEDIYIWGIVGPSGGKADVYIDEQYVDTIDYYYPVERKNVILFAKKGLNRENHTVKVVNTGEKQEDATDNKITFDGYESAAGAVFQASSGFSSIQGKKGWSYLQKNGNEYSELTFETEHVWPNPDYSYEFIENDPIGHMNAALKRDRNNFYIAKTDDTLRVGPDYMKPGKELEAVKRWTASEDGDINISGTLMKKMGYELGDGVTATIMKNETTIWGPEKLDYHDVVGKEFDINTDVKQGDEIYFILSAGENNESDETVWDPTIFYGDSGVVKLPEPQKDPIGGNIAYGKSAKASSSEKGNEAANANDGHRTTRWTASDGSLNNWWQVDLGDSYQLERTEIHWEKDHAYQYKIEVSNDAENWVEVVDKTSNSDASQLMKDEINNTIARYIRITVTGGVSKSTWASINEFKAYSISSGKKSTADSFQLNNPPSSANDGDITTRWTAEDSEVNHWWQIDLGESYYLSNSRIRWEFNQNYQYQIQVSNDKNNWLTVVDQTDNASATQVMEDDMNAKGRYVRITVTGLPKNVWASINDFQLFGIPAEITGESALNLSVNKYESNINQGDTGKIELSIKNDGNENIYDVGVNLFSPPSPSFKAKFSSEANFKELTPGEEKVVELEVEVDENAIPGSVDLLAEAVFSVDDIGTQNGTEIKIPINILGDALKEDSYLSDLPFVGKTINGWGTMKKDKSISGQEMKIDGKSYVKGLGVHAPSELSFYLGGTGRKFTSAIGVDDGGGKQGSVTFQVWGDEEKLYESDTLWYGSSAQNIEVDVEGVEVLKLIVTDGGNGKSSDHANWANALVSVLQSGDQVDTTELEALIKQAKAHSNEEGKYTEESYESLQAAIQVAEDSLKSVETEEEVVEAMDALQAAIDGLESNVEDVDTTPLEALIKQAKAHANKEGKYTEESYESLQTAIQVAEDSLKSLETEEAVEEAIAALQAAIDGLESDVEDVDITPLEALIKQAKAHANEEGKYTEESYEALQTAIQVAEDSLKSVETEEEVVEAMGALQAAIDGLESDVEDVDTTPLEALIKQAKAHANEEGKYTEELYEALQAAIQVAEDSLKSVETEEAVEEAIAALQAAIDGLESDVEDVDITPLEALIKQAKAHSNEEGKYTEESYEALQAAIQVAEDSLKSVETEEEVVEAMGALQAAIDGLESDVEDVDITPLEALIKQAKAHSNEEGKYTEESYEALQTAIQVAEDSLKSVETEEEVVEAMGALQAAIDGLESDVEDVDTTKLEALIKQAKAHANEEGKYTKESYEALQTAIQVAESSLKSLETEEAVEEAIADLQAAIDGLEKSAPVLNDTEKLKQGERKDGEMLPSTATSIYNLLGMGVVLLLVGTGLVFMKRRSKGLDK